MRLPIHYVDVFTDHRFGGNPAAVVPLESWLPDATLQAIANENNLSETAFFVPDGDGFELRWFTPTAEIDLCGHATLGTAFVLATYIQPDRQRFVFRTRQAGMLSVTRDGPRFVLDFPAWVPAPVAETPAWLSALNGPAPQGILATRDHLVVYATADEVLALKPDYRALGAAADRMIIVTAPGTGGIDYVLRFFAPSFGIDEDPVTGSAQCSLIPYWTKRLGRDRLEARQLSVRGGTLTGTLTGDRVGIGGQAVAYLEGFITV